MLTTARATNPAFAVAGAMDALNALSKTISRARRSAASSCTCARARSTAAACASPCAPRRRARPARARTACSPSPPGARHSFGEAERTALALTEALTRLADRADQVPDTLWDAAAEHFDEGQLGALVLDIATVNLWNRLSIATRQVVGDQSW